MPIIINKGFSASENGFDIDTYEPGEYEDLPEVALAHGLAIEAIDQKSVPTGDKKGQTNAAPKAPAKKPATKRTAKKA